MTVHELIRALDGCTQQVADQLGHRMALNVQRAEALIVAYKDAILKDAIGQVLKHEDKQNNELEPEDRELASDIRRAACFRISLLGSAYTPQQRADAEAIWRDA